MAENRMSEYSQMGRGLTLRQAVDRLFEDALVPHGSQSSMSGAVMPPLDVRDSGEAFVVEAALPGIKPDDVEITIQNQVLTLRGEFTESRDGGGDGDYLYRERAFGRFSRQVQLPTRVDAEHADADFENGLLRLTIPKAEETKPRRIEIKARGDGSSSGG